MKKNHIILIFALFFVISGCDEPPVERPENLISRDKMIDMLADIHLAEAAFNNLRHRDSLLENSTSGDFYYSLLEKYGVADTVFEKSFIFYASQPRDFEKMYRQSMNQLSEMEQEYSGRKKELLELEIEEE